jgi:DNA repair ATPase RecN
MPNETNSQQLLRRIKNRRRTLDAYLQSAKPRAERLTYVSVISSALVASVIAAISANLSKSKDAEAPIVSAGACNAELERLQAMVEFRQVSLEEAVTLFQQYITTVPFVPEQLPRIKHPAGRKN